ncbi:hypothetical protein KY359_01080 [Candidatus Woesearchaeota archaeon]|nr:hypothetical protein [Candidatus Woesearchaeota archaeon]
MDCVQQGEEEDGKMSRAGSRRKVQIIITALLSLIILATVSLAQFPQPGPPDTMENTSSQSPDATGGYAMTTGGGTITWLNINATTQNPHWKAYVGNISGKLALQDASSNTIYDWNISSMEGEVYATRKSAVVEWNSIACANLAQIQAEETALNMTGSSEDSITNTFNKKSHSSFYAGLTSIAADSCNSTNLYVNSESTSDFAELLLYDGSYMVYAALLEDAITGFDGNQYDFQMLVPDSGLEGSQTPETYYFYVELI